MACQVFFGGFVVTIGQAVVKLRKQLGHPGRAWSQDRLGRELGGVTGHTVSQWERERQVPSPANFLRLARLSDGNINWFFAERSGLDLGEDVYTSRRAIKGLEMLAVATEAPPGVRARGAERLPDDDRQRYHAMLDEVLSSRNEDAITAVKANLAVFSKYVRSCWRSCAVANSSCHRPEQPRPFDR
jgi:transcriptional regulator with XRE-family HTH domain